VGERFSAVVAVSASGVACAHFPNIVPGCEARANTVASGDIAKRSATIERKRPLRIEGLKTSRFRLTEKSISSVKVRRGCNPCQEYSRTIPLKLSIALGRAKETMRCPVISSRIGNWVSHLSGIARDASRMLMHAERIPKIAISEFFRPNRA
jgi:hypothetical protein